MIITFLVSLYIGIITHELGHLIIAKLCKCGVPVYSIGFGKLIFQKKLGKTIYQLRLIPFGGYCELEGELKQTENKTAFTNLKYRKKFFISTAGCAVNIIMGIVVGFIGLKLFNVHLVYFGTISVILGITNLIPIIPCLDGGYLVFFPFCTHIWGEHKGIIIFEKIVKISFKIVMWTNYLCIPWLFFNWRKICL